LAGGVDGREGGGAEKFGGEERADGGLSGAAHSARKNAVIEEAEGVGAEFRGIVGEETAGAVLDGRRGMAVAEDGKAGGHGFKRGGVVAVFELRMRGVNEKAMAPKDLLEIAPIAGGLDARKLGIAANESDRKIGEGGLMEIPEKSLWAAKNVVGNAQALGEIALPGKIVGRIHGERNDVVCEAPGESLQFRDGDDVNAAALHVLMDGAAELGRIAAGVLLEDHAFESEMDDEEARAGEGFDVEEISEIVSDDAIVGFTGSEDLIEVDEASEWRKGTDRFVPARGVAAREIHDDVQWHLQETQLVDPGFVAIEDEEAGHGVPGSYPETRNQWRANRELRSASAAESSGPQGYGFELAAAGFETGATREEHHADILKDIAQFGDLVHVEIELAVNFGLQEA